MGVFNGVPHKFVSGDKSREHGRDPKKIGEKLEEMRRKLEEAGHVFDEFWVSKPDLTREEKIQNLCQHSEKIAIAFILLTTPDKETLVLSKNLRVCGDCHKATKLLSRIYSGNL
jgi:hypothetical protein